MSQAVKAISDTIWIGIAIAAGIVGSVLLLIATLMKAPSVRIRIRKTDDGRFYVRYYWHWWESWHRAYCKDLEELRALVAQISEPLSRPG
jgi:hypothetical protein